MITNIESKIPSNDKNYFIIKKGFWRNSIEILIDDFFNFNVFNLFMIIKSYQFEDFFSMEQCYIILNKNDVISFTYKKIELNIITTLDFNEFVYFIESTIFKEKEYIRDYTYLGFMIIFNKYSKIIVNDCIFPVYPWKKTIKDKFMNKSYYDEKYNINLKDKETILKLKEEINILKSRIK